MTQAFFSSGTDITNPESIINYISDFVKHFGKSKLVCFHINDSNAPFNSRRDLHQGLGQGYLFKDNLQTIKEL